MPNTPKPKSSHPASSPNSSPLPPGEPEGVGCQRSTCNYATPVIDRDDYRALFDGERATG